MPEPIGENGNIGFVIQIIQARVVVAQIIKEYLPIV